MKGIDVSSYQGVVNWSKVKAAGVGFAILKIIRKDLNPDKQFENNWKGCEDANLTVQGVYNYTYANTVAKAISDAKMVVKILAGRHTMVWLDIEDSCMKNLGSKIVDIVNAYQKVILEAGCQFGVYTGLSFYNSHIKQYNFTCPMWIARYPSDSKIKISYNPSMAMKPTGITNLYGWQYSSKGSVNGITGDVDFNEWYVDIEAKEMSKESNVAYDQLEFVGDVMNILNAVTPVGAYVKTITVSNTINRKHSVVTPLERYMKALGYYTGTIEADVGQKPCFGNGMRKATLLFQEKVVKPTNEKYIDGIWTSRGASWKKALGV